MLKISLVLPSLNNPRYLNWCLKALRENTKNPLEILVHVNECTGEENRQVCRKWDVDWYQESNVNFGIAKPTNQLASRATGDVLIYWNDDIFAAPAWDVPLLEKMNPNIFYQYLTPVMFERQFNNPSMNSPFDFGDTPENFQKQEFIDTWKEKRQIKQDIISCWGPPVMTKELWDHVGGFNENYFPGWGTDSDLVTTIYFKAKETGKPYEFRGVADSGVYHIQSVGLSKITDGPSFQSTAIQIFRNRWGMDAMNVYNNLIGTGNPIV